jgi:translocation protein SEC63
MVNADLPAVACALHIRQRVSDFDRSQLGSLQLHILLLKILQAFRKETDTSAIIEACGAAEEYKELLRGDKSESGLARIEQRIVATGEFSQFAAGLIEKDKKKLEHTEDAQRRKALALIWVYLGRIDLAEGTLNDEKFEVGLIA